MNRTKPPESRSPNWSILLGLAAAVLVGLSFWLQSTNEPPPQEPAVVASLPAQGGAVAPPAEPAIKHPVGSIAVEPMPSAEPLPPREQSDPAAQSAAQTLATAAEIADVLFPDGLVRRFVATVDNLPRETLSMQIRMIKGMPGQFQVSGGESAPSIAIANAARYSAFVRFVQGLDAKKLVSVYLRFYPLLQEEYRSLGFPNKQFNDRLVETIDDMLSAPEPEEPIALVQPKVMYRYADPVLESMSAGRKIMMRVGKDNAGILKAKLREIRTLLVTAKPN